MIELLHNLPLRVLSISAADPVLPAMLAPYVTLGNMSLPALREPFRGLRHEREGGGGQSHAPCRDVHDLDRLVSARTAHSVLAPFGRRGPSDPAGDLPVSRDGRR